MPGVCQPPAWRAGRCRGRRPAATGPGARRSSFVRGAVATDAASRPRSASPGAGEDARPRLPHAHLHPPGAPQTPGEQWPRAPPAARSPLQCLQEQGRPVPGQVVEAVGDLPSAVLGRWCVFLGLARPAAGAGPGLLPGGPGANGVPVHGRPQPRPRWRMGSFPGRSGGHGGGDADPHHRRRGAASAWPPLRRAGHRGDDDRLLPDRAWSSSSRWPGSTGRCGASPPAFARSPAYGRSVTRRRSADRLRKRGSGHAGATRLRAGDGTAAAPTTPGPPPGAPCPRRGRRERRPRSGPAAHTGRTGAAVSAARRRGRPRAGERRWCPGRGRRSPRPSAA